jgi:hypothetical protein
MTTLPVTASVCEYTGRLAKTPSPDLFCECLIYDAHRDVTGAGLSRVGDSSLTSTGVR